MGGCAILLPTVYTTFSSRESRSRFVAAQFADYLKDTVLDVGCFEAPLRNILSSSTYTGIDIAGKPDINLNLEAIVRLPFDDKSFKTVLCIDVLEHLDNLHLIFEEVVRVSGQYIIVSLPNCWRSARNTIGRGKGRLTHYGLHLHKSHDRHKWFFNITEARDFIIGKAKELDLHVKDMFITEKPRVCMIRWFRKLIYPGDRYYNRYSGTLWSVLQKTKSGSGVEERPGQTAAGICC